MRVDSTLGVGTTVRCYLPTSSEAPGPPPPSPRSLPPTEVTGRTILVVEDEPGVRRLTERILGGSGFRVLSAPDGVAALDIIEDADQAIDLLLTDVVMPGMSGRDLRDVVRDARPSLPVLFMSGYTSGILDDDYGDHDLLEKPFTRASLLEAVASALGDAG